MIFPITCYDIWCYRDDICHKGYVCDVCKPCPHGNDVDISFQIDLDIVTETNNYINLEEL